MFGLMSLLPLAQADIIYTFDQGGSCCGTGIFATLSLHAVNANTVEVTETLSAGNVYAFTGTGRTLEFNIDKPFTIVDGTLTAGFSLSGADSPSPFPNFTSSIICTAPCIYGNGTSAPEFLGPLSFQVTNAGGLTPADFVSSTGGIFFTSDIGVPTTGGRFSTGNVAASIGIETRGAPPPDVPEPSTILLYASGMGAVVLLRKQIARQRG